MGGADQKISQKRFEPERALVFVPVNDVEHHLAGDDRRPGRAEMKFHFPAVAAFKACRNFAFIRQATALAERRPDKAHALPAMRADKTFGRRGGFGSTELTDGRVEKSQAGIKPAFQVGFQRPGIHSIETDAVFSSSRDNIFQRTRRVIIRTSSADQPSIKRFVPQNHGSTPAASRVRKPYDLSQKI